MRWTTLEMEPVISTSWHSPCYLLGLCCAVSDETAGLGTDYNPIFHLGDAGRRPGDALGFLALAPGANRAFQYHLAAVHLDADPVSVDLGISLEGLHDLALKLGRFDLGLHRDQVGDTLDALHLAHSVFSGGLLVLPLHRPFERYPAVLHDDLDLVVGNRQFRLQGGNGIARNIRIWTLIDGRQPHLEVVRNRKNPGDALRGGLGFKPVRVTGNKTGQRNDAI